MRSLARTLADSLPLLRLTFTLGDLACIGIAATGAARSRRPIATRA
jgi:hypothetical protein